MTVVSYFMSEFTYIYNFCRLVLLCPLGGKINMDDTSYLWAYCMISVHIYVHKMFCTRIGALSML